MSTSKDLLHFHGNAFLEALSTHTLDVEDQSYIMRITQTLLDLISGIEREGRLVLRKPVISPNKNLKVGYLSKLIKVLQVASSNQVQMYGFMSIANFGLVSYTTNPSVATCSMLPLKNDEKLYRIDFHSPLELIVQTDPVGLISLSESVLSPYNRKRSRTLETKSQPGIPMQTAMVPRISMQVQGAMGPGIPTQHVNQPGPGYPFQSELPAKITIQLPIGYHHVQEPTANYFMQKRMLHQVTAQPQVAIESRATVELRDTLVSQYQEAPTHQECLYQLNETTTESHEESMFRFLEIDQITTYYDERDTEGNEEATENEETKETVEGEETPQVVIDSMHMIQQQRFSPGPSPPPPPQSPRDVQHCVEPAQDPMPVQNLVPLDQREPTPSSPELSFSPVYPPTSPDSPH